MFPLHAVSEPNDNKFEGVIKRVLSFASKCTVSCAHKELIESSGIE